MTDEQAWLYAASWGSYITGDDPGACLIVLSKLPQFPEWLVAVFMALPVAVGGVGVWLGSGWHHDNGSRWGVPLASIGALIMIVGALWPWFVWSR